MKFLRAIPVLIFVFLTAAPPSGSDEEAKFVYAAPTYATLDPAHMRTPNDERLVLTLFDSLTAIEARKGTVVPAAAARWTESSDGKTWTFHLRPTATWSDGSPVKATDFIQAWRRMIDPYGPSRHAWMFRRIEGVKQIAEGERAMSILLDARKRLERALGNHKDGIPGSAIEEVVERTGVRPYAEKIKDSDVKRMLRWGDDVFRRDRAEKVIRKLKSVRKDIKKTTLDVFDRFGKEVGVVAKGDHVLDVRLEGRCPWLPSLMARAAFAPIHASTLKGYKDAWEAGTLVTNGAYVLEKRGVKAHAGQPNPMSVVHVARAAKYDGPSPAKCADILCFTGQGVEEDMRRYENGDMQWIAEPSAEEPESLSEQKGFQMHPDGSVLCLRFRCDRAPFDKKEVREAFVLSIDRKNLTRSFWPKLDVASRIFPPAVDRSVPDARVSERNASAAKKALGAAKYTPDSFPWVELCYLEQHEDGADRLTRQWEKTIGVEVGLRIEEKPAALDALIRAGAYGMVISAIRPPTADPETFVTRFRADNPLGGLGWEDEVFERLVAAAEDVDGFLAGGAEALAGLPSALAGGADRARTGDAKAKDEFRRALLRGAEARLIKESVVVPLLYLKRVEIRGGIRGIGEPDAWRNPAFFGSLGDVTR